MPLDPDEPVTLTSAATEFKAATIARALEARGIPARIYGALTTGFRAEAPGVSHVMVLRKDLDRARAALAEIQSSQDDIDWSEAERAAPHPDAPLPDGPIPFPDARGQGASQSERRWAWTIVLVLLLPIGGVLTALTAPTALDPVVKAIGPTLLAIAAVMAFWLITTRREDDADSDDAPHRR